MGINNARLRFLDLHQPAVHQRPHRQAAPSVYKQEKHHQGNPRDFDGSRDGNDEPKDGGDGKGHGKGLAHRPNLIGDHPRDGRRDHADAGQGALDAAHRNAVLSAVLEDHGDVAAPDHGPHVKEFNQVQPALCNFVLHGINSL